MTMCLYLRGAHVLEDQQVPAVSRELEHGQIARLLPVLLQLRLPGNGPQRLLSRSAQPLHLLLSW